MYACYEISDALRNILLELYPPKYSTVICRHVTIEFGVPKTYKLPPDTILDIIGYVDSGDGLEGFLVSVNGTTKRPDGKTYHITHSLDKSKYKPVNTNDIISQATPIRSITGKGIAQLNY